MAASPLASTRCLTAARSSSSSLSFAPGTSLRAPTTCVRALGKAQLDYVQSPAGEEPSMATHRAPGHRLPLISRLSAAVEHQAVVQKFETVAGRAACLGVAFTMLIELASGAPVIVLDMEQAQLFAGTLLLAVAMAGTLAVRRRRAQSGRLLLEAVVSSLTCAQRSASSLTSITPSNLDSSVDRIMEATFDRDLTAWLAGIEAEQQE